MLFRSLLNPASQGQCVELVYLGLALFARGRGLGRRLLRHGIRLLRGRRERLMTLAVDDRNAPALRLYESEAISFDLDIAADQARCVLQSGRHRAVLDRLGTDPARTLFVAGSALDVPGAKGVGMPVYWHNRVGLPPRDDARPDYLEKSLEPLAALF